MNSRMVLLVASFWWAALTPAATAQSIAKVAPHWQVKSFVHDGGLEHQNVFYIDFDKYGTVWLATTEGLRSFDGYRWKHYTTEHGLPSNHVRCVRIASDGRLWVGTDDGAGVFENEQFTDAGTSGKLAGTSIRRIVEDNDGSIWFCCDQWPNPAVTGGLTRLQNGSFTTWQKNDGLPSDYVSDFVIDSRGRQFVLTNKGLAQFDETGFLRPLEDAGFRNCETYIWSLVESEKFGIVVATAQHFYHLQDNQWRQYPNRIKKGFKEPKLTTARDGNIFACTVGENARILRWREGEFVDATEPLRLHSGGVQVIAEDAEGAIWVGGYHRLARWHRFTNQWQYYEDLGQPRCADRGGGIWFDFPKGGLVRLNQDQWSEFEDVSIPIHELPDGKILMQHKDGLACWIDGQLIPMRESTVGLVKPKLLHVDGSGTIWAWGIDQNTVATATAWFDGHRWNQRPMPSTTNTAVVSHSYPDPVSGVWCVLSKNGFAPFRLVHLDKHLTKDFALPAEVQSHHAPRVFVCKNNNVWLYGLFGLYSRQQSKDANWETIPTPGRNVEQIHSIGDEIWASCGGLVGGRPALIRFRDTKWTSFPQLRGRFVGRTDRSLYVSANRKIQRIDAGLDQQPIALFPPFNTEIGTITPRTKGELWIGAGTRTYRYLPDRLPPETEAVQIQERIQKDDAFVLKLSGIEKFTPRADQGDFKFSFQLDGKNWTTPMSFEREVRITDVPVGDHELRVRVHDQDGQTDSTPAVVSFSVSPIPIQQRVWFKPVVVGVLLTLLILAMTATAGWYKFRTLAAELEKRVIRKSQELQGSERNFQLLFEESRDAIIVFDVDGRLIRRNKAAEEFVGVNDKHAISISNLFADQRERDRFERDLNNQGYLSGSRFRIVDWRQNERAALLSVNPCKDDRDVLRGYQVIITDISEREQLEQQLRETEKMEAVGRMAGAISHDFNNFLQIIVCSTDLINLKKADDPKIDKAVEMIHQAAERARNLTSDIQSFSRTPTTKPKLVDTRQVILGLMELLERLRPKNVKTEIDLSPDLGNTFATEKQIEQLVANLAINGFQAMPNGGRLLIKGLNATVPDEESGDLSPRGDANYVKLMVEDTGVGISERNVGKIFEPFFTTKSEDEGTGLGLAIVYGIVQQFGGRIYVSSKLRRGTRFTVLLPYRDPSPWIEQPPESGIIPLRKRGKILLVDDEANIRELAKLVLESNGYFVYLADNGNNARSKILKNRLKISLVISDIVMPDTSGVELSKWMQTNCPEIPLLLMSGYPQGRYSSRSDVEILRKPFQSKQLLSRVEEILNRKAHEKMSTAS